MTNLKLLPLILLVATHAFASDPPDSGENTETVPTENHADDVRAHVRKVISRALRRPCAANLNEPTPRSEEQSDIGYPVSDI